MKTRILLTHTDLDGAACAVVWRHFHDGPIFHCNYNDIDATVEKVCFENPDAEVVLADISPKNIPEALWDQITIYDHHANNDFPKRLAEGKAKGVFNNSKCGARILAEALGGENPIVGALLDQVEAWDLWQLDSGWRVDGAAHNTAFSFYGMAEYIRRRLDDHDLCPDEVSVVRTLQARDAAYIAGRVKAAQLSTDSEGRHFRWVYASRCTSEVGTAIAKDVDYGMVLVPEHNKVELRSVGDCNVGQIARSRGGGGHDHAAGYPFEYHLPE